MEIDTCIVKSNGPAQVKKGNPQVKLDVIKIDGIKEKLLITKNPDKTLIIEYMTNLSIKFIDYTTIFKEAGLEILGRFMVLNQFMNNKTNYYSNTAALQ